MGLTEQPRQAPPAADFDPSDGNDDAEEVGAREPAPTSGAENGSPNGGST